MRASKKQSAATLNIPADAIIVPKKRQDVVFPIVNAIILIILMAITLYPVINTVAYSFSDDIDALRGGITVYPRVFSLHSYDKLINDSQLYRAFLVTASKTIIITVLNLVLTSMLAFALSRKEYPLRKPITIILVLTMYFNAGIIPTFLWVGKKLGLMNVYWVYIIPCMFSCFNMIVLRTYIAGLPEALVESARIDGASDFRTFWQIIFPLCTPVLATVALFVAVGSWNSWFETKLYIQKGKNLKALQTLQYYLQSQLQTAGNSGSNAAGATADAMKNKDAVTSTVAFRSAVTVVSSIPILVVYPFLQKYFVTGMVLGSVKG